MQKFTLSNKDFEMLNLKEKISKSERKLDELEQKMQQLNQVDNKSEVGGLGGNDFVITTAI